MSMTSELSAFSFGCALLLQSDVIFVFNARDLNLSTLFVRQPHRKTFLQFHNCITRLCD
jgi:hypothetical protein